MNSSDTRFYIMIINYIAPFVGVAALFLPLPLSAAPHVVSDPATYIDGKNPEERFAGIAAYCAAPIIGQVISLDSKDAWVVSADPANVGKTEKWFTSPRPDAKPIRVPGMMQETLGEYHGVAWYWRTVNIAENPHQNGRYIIRFWSSADILVTSSVRVEDLYVKPNAKSGVIEVEVNVRNALD